MIFSLLVSIVTLALFWFCFIQKFIWSGLDVLNKKKNLTHLCCIFTLSPSIFLVQIAGGNTKNLSWTVLRALAYVSVFFLPPWFRFHPPFVYQPHCMYFEIFSYFYLLSMFFLSYFILLIVKLILLINFS